MMLGTYTSTEMNFLQSSEEKPPYFDLKELSADNLKLRFPSLPKAQVAYLCLPFKGEVRKLRLWTSDISTTR